MKQRDDTVLLRDMVDLARKAVAATRGRTRSDLDSDDLVAAALERFIEVLGEAASKVSPGTRANHPAIRWHEIIGMRNRLIHGYASVDHDIVWAVATEDLPGLLTELERALGE